MKQTMQCINVEIISRIAKAKQSSIQKTEDCFQQQFRQKFKEETDELLHLRHSSV